MVCLLLGPVIGYSMGVNGDVERIIQEENSTAPVIDVPQENAETTDQEPKQIPPEVLEMLLQQSPQNQGTAEIFRPLNTPYRILLLGIAVIILFLGIVICRYLSWSAIWSAQENTIFLFFGFMGALSGLFIACGCIGSVYLHVASAVCTAISGFTIGAFLAPQFSLTRRWVIGIRRENMALGDTNDSIDD